MASSSRKVVYAALAGNSLIALTKFIAAALTGSSAMVSEGIHSVVDTGNQILLLYGLRRASRKPDREFPFGYGKEIYFWSFVVAILIFALGAGISFYEGVHHMLHPVPADNPFVNYAVLLLAMVFEGAAWLFALREFSRARGEWGYIEAVQRGKNPSLFVVLFEDSAAMLGLLAAFTGIFLTHITGNPFYDGAASIFIGLILAGTAVWLARETKGLLIGESANPEIVEGIEKIVLGEEAVRSVKDILTLHMGPEYILVNMNVDFSDRMTAGEIEKTVARIAGRIKDTYGTVKRVFIEAEDAGIR